MILSTIKSPFEKLVEAKYEQDSIYEKYIEIDEPKEIATAWRNYSFTALEVLNSVSILSDFLFNRFLDEYSKEKKAIQEDEARYKKIMNRINESLITEFYSTMMMDMHSRLILNEFFGVEGEEFCEYQIYVLNNLAKIESLYLQLKEYAPREISPIVSKLFELEKREKLIELESNMEFDEEKILMIKKEIGLYHLEQARYLYTMVEPLVVSLNADWWMEDYILRYFIVEESLKHLQEVKTMWKDVPGEMQRLALGIEQAEERVFKAKRNALLAKHYEKLGVSAGIEGNHEMATNYFKKALDYVKESMSLLQKVAKPSKELEALQKEIHLMNEILANMAGLSEIAASFEKINELLKENNREELTKLLNRMSDIANNLVGTTDVEFLSMLPSFYLPLINLFSELIKGNEIPTLNVNKFMMGYQMLDNFMKSMSKKLDHFKMDLEIQIAPDPVSFQIQLESMINLTGVIISTLSLIPKSIENRNEEIFRALTIRHLARAIAISNKIEHIPVGGLIYGLLLNAKAYFYSNAAVNYSKRVKDKSRIPEKMCNYYLYRFLVEGLTSEINLFSLILQFFFFNTLLPVFEEIVLTSRMAKMVGKDIIEAINNDLSKMHPVEILLNNIHNALSKIHEGKENISKYIETIDWNLVETKRMFIGSTIEMLNSIKQDILAETYFALKNREDCIIALEKSHEFARSAAANLEKAPIKARFLQQIYEAIVDYARFIQDNKNRVENGMDLVQLPVDKALKLLKDMIFGI